MCWQRGISDAGIAKLAFCDHLERVDLLGSPTGDGAINALRGNHYAQTFLDGSGPAAERAQAAGEGGG